MERENFPALKCLKSAESKIAPTEINIMCLLAFPSFSTSSLAFKFSPHSIDFMKAFVSFRYFNLNGKKVVSSRVKRNTNFMKFIAKLFREYLGNA